MKNKQEVIQQHYIDLLNADKFFKLKPHIDEDGWCLMFDEKGEKVSLTFKELGFEKDPLGKTVAGGLTQKGHKWRPKSLEGFENNNGWTCIESVDDLPTSGMKNYMYCVDGKPSVFVVNLRVLLSLSKDGIVSHYMALPSPEAPIY